MQLKTTHIKKLWANSIMLNPNLIKIIRHQFILKLTKLIHGNLSILLQANLILKVKHSSKTLRCKYKKNLKKKKINCKVLKLSLEKTNLYKLGK